MIAQIYGAANYYQYKHKCKVKPILITSYILSDQARNFAKFLGVNYKEQYEFKPYPMIKCNIAKKTREKIYHLPMDQKYDSVVVDDEGGECYVYTVKEAEDMGFRRAFYWKGKAVAL